MATTAVDWLWFWVFDIGCCKETDFYLFTYCELFWLFTVYCWSVCFSVNRIGSFRLYAAFYIMTGCGSKLELSELFSSFDGLLIVFWEVLAFSWSLWDLLKMRYLALWMELSKEVYAGRKVAYKDDLSMNQDLAKLNFEIKINWLIIPLIKWNKLKIIIKLKKNSPIVLGLIKQTIRLNKWVKNIGLLSAKSWWLTFKEYRFLQDRSNYMIISRTGNWNLYYRLS